MNKRFKRKLIEKIPGSSLVTCDNISCGFEIPYQENVNTRIFINMPCPKCGQNLLTLQDYNDHARIEKAVDWANKWLSWTMFFYSDKSWETKRPIVNVHVHNGVKVTEQDI